MRTLLSRRVGHGFWTAAAVGAVLVSIASIPASAFVVRGGHPGGHIAMRPGGFHFRSGMAPGVRTPRMMFVGHGRRFPGQFLAGLGFPFFGWYPGWNNGYSYPAVSGAEPGTGADAFYAAGGASNGSSAAPTPGWHGDCAIHELIYGDDGHYVGQKVVEACN